ncbi:MAG TPA: hypothetical protein PLI52_02910 [Prochlorococcaceae cyanobacterium AMR_MDS_5431]|nr:hypothetical protein [Prochlorococcaceae cyanobacterium AMR_MDS_5431]
MLTSFVLPIILGAASKFNFPSTNLTPPPETNTTEIQQKPKSDSFFFKALANLIGYVESHGSGGYNSANAGYPGDLGKNGLIRFSGRDCSKVTIGEVKNWQRQGLIFAVGRYQMIPRTFKAAQLWAGLGDHDYFSPENQDKMLLAIIKHKRPSVLAYIKGSGNLNRAINDLAMEWAGLPTLNGYSYYSGGNKAHTSVNAVVQALQTSRQSYLQTI